MIKCFFFGFGVHAAVRADLIVFDQGLVRVVDVLFPECLHLIKILYYRLSFDHTLPRIPIQILLEWTFYK